MGDQAIPPAASSLRCFSQTLCPLPPHSTSQAHTHKPRLLCWGRLARRLRDSAGTSCIFPWLPGSPFQRASGALQKSRSSLLLLPRPFHHPPHLPPGLDCWPGMAQGAWSWSSTAQSGSSWCPVMASIPQLVCPCGEGCWVLVERLLCQDSEAGSEEPVFPPGRSSKSPCFFVLGDGSEGKQEMVVPVHN